MDAPEITADEPEARKEQLKQAAQEHKQELSAEQQTLKEEIASSHGGDLIKCEVFEADEFDRQLWHEVYEDYGIEPLMTIVENVAEALNEERRKKQGAVDEFHGDK